MEENLILPLSNYAVELAKKNELIAAAKIYNFIFDYASVVDASLIENQSIIQREIKKLIEIHTKPYLLLNSLENLIELVVQNKYFDKDKNQDKEFKNKLEEKLRKLYFSRAHGDIAISARDVTVILYKWPNFNEIKLLPLFGNNVYLKSLYWVPFLPFWTFPSKYKNHVNLRRELFAEFESELDEVVYLENVNQFGHFLFDCLTNLLVFDLLAIDKKIPIITTSLNNFQRDIITTLFGEFKFIEINIEEINQLTTFKKVHMMLDIDVNTKIEFVRNRVNIFRDNASKSNSLLSSNAKYIYITRDPKDNSSRVINSQEITQYLRSLDFEVIYGGEYNCAEMIHYLENAEIIVADPITPHLNFHAFATATCYLVALIPQWLLDDPSDQLLEGGLELLLPFYDRTEFVGGELVDIKDVSHFSKCSYSLEKIGNAIAKINEQKSHIFS